MAVLTVLFPCSLLLLFQPVTTDIVELEANITALWAALNQLASEVHQSYDVHANIEDHEHEVHYLGHEDADHYVHHSEKHLQHLNRIHARNHELQSPVPTGKSNFVDDVSNVTSQPIITKPKPVQLRAFCDMKPNRGLQRNRQHLNIRGKVIFNQPAGGPLSIQVNLKGIRPTNGKNSSKHGFHVHEFIPVDEGYCNQAGSHYNPTGADHGGSFAGIRHVGDFGNVEAMANSGINVVLVDYIASLDGPHSILNKTLVLHEKEDDLGSNEQDPQSRANGNAGRRLACCTIRAS